MENDTDKKNSIFGMYVDGITSKKIEIGEVGSEIDTIEHIKEVLGDSRLSGFYYEEFDKNGNPYTRSIIIGDVITISEYIEGMEFLEYSYDPNKYKNILKTNPNTPVGITFSSRGAVDLEHGEPKVLEARDILVDSEEELFRLHELRKNKYNSVGLPVVEYFKIRNLDEAVRVLENARNNGKSIYMDYIRKRNGS
jgi:hypothetical protein